MKVVLRILHKIIDVSGYVCIAALLLMVANIFIDVLVRYVVFDVFRHLQWIAAIDWFNEHVSWLGSVGMQEMEWHFFSAVFLLGLGYTLRDNAHVRVDVLYERFSRTTQAWINIVGGFVFTLPFAVLIVYYGADFFYESFESMENKGDPGSLPRLWPGKLLIPMAFVFLILSVVTVMLSEFLVIQEEKKTAVEESRK
jgi:TRAP-type mannitol/chloroaromatic compound transport system permease small subunit